MSESIPSATECVKNTIFRTSGTTLFASSFGCCAVFIQSGPIAPVASHIFLNTFIVSGLFFSSQQMFAFGRQRRDAWNSLFAGVSTGSITYGIWGQSQFHAIRGGIALGALGLGGYLANELFMDWKSSLASIHLKEKYGSDYDTSKLFKTNAFDRVKKELTQFYVPLIESEEKEVIHQNETNKISNNNTSSFFDGNWLPLKRLKEIVEDQRKV